MPLHKSYRGIALGTIGVGAIATDGVLGRALTLAGASFMIAYGARAFLAAWRSAAGPELAAAPELPLAATVLATLAVTLLNPHVYLDAFMLLGTAAGQYAPADRPWFALGAITASVGWFATLGHGAALLAGPFRQPVVRTALDVLVGVLMWRTAASLLAQC